MRRWTSWVKVGGLISTVVLISLGFFTLQASAVRPTLNNCIEFEDRLVCPDSYCAPGEDNFTCDSNGRQCYCKTSLLAGSINNSDCEVATGSEMFFDRDYGQPNNPVKNIYLQGGIWQSVIDVLKLNYSEADLNKHGVFLAKPNTNHPIDYIRFTKSSDGKKFNLNNYFSSSFLTLLSERLDGKKLSINKDTGQEAGDEIAFKNSWFIGVVADIDNNLNSGTVTTQVFQTAASDGNPQICAVRPHHIIGSQTPFFHKLTPTGTDYNSMTDTSPIACIGGIKLLSALVLPFNDPDFLGDNLKQSAIVTSRNCTPLEMKKAWFGNKEPIQDLSLLAGNLIVAASSRRTIYELPPEDLFLGKIFKAESSNEREAKVDDIVKNLCEGTCTTKADQTKDCMHCAGNRLLLTNLRDNPNKSYSQILYEILSNNKLSATDEANCGGINPAFGYMNTGEVEPIKSNISALYGEKNLTETEINRRLPKSLIKVCQDGWEQVGGRLNNRVMCKVKALECYENSLKPDLTSQDVCSSLNSKELSTTKWAFCPVITTQAQAADQLQSKSLLNQILNVPASKLEGKVEGVWGTFRDVANILVVVGFIIVIFSQVTGYGLSNYHIKKALPKLIMIIILINLSMFLMKLTLDVASITGSSVSGLLEKIIDSSRIEVKFIDVITGALSVGVGAGALVLGGLAFAIPLLIAAIVGAAGFLLTIAARQVAIVALAILSPIALVSLIFPNSKLFNKWLWGFLGMAGLYPLLVFLNSSATLVKNVILVSETTNVALRLTALALPALSIALLPKITKEIIRSTSSMGTKLDNFMTGFGEKAKRHHQQSYFGQSIQESRAARMVTFFSGNQFGGAAGWLSRGIFGRLNKSAGFNYLTSGAGNRFIQRAGSLDRQQQGNIKQVIDGDLTLLDALLSDNGRRGAGYASLNQRQRAKYDLVMAGGIQALKNLNLIAPEILSTAGVFNQKYYHQIFTNARAAGAGDDELISSMVGALRAGLKTGDGEVVGLMQAYIRSSGQRTLSPSPSMTDAMTALQGCDPSLLSTLINLGANGGDLDNFKPTGNSSIDDRVDRLKKLKLPPREIAGAAILMGVTSGHFTPSQLEEAFAKLNNQLAGAGAIRTPDDHVDAKGRITAITAEQQEQLNFIINLHELATKELGGRIKLSIDQQAADGSITRKKLNEVYDDKLITLAKDTKSLPDGWTEDRDLLRPLDEKLVESEIDGALDKFSPNAILNQIFNDRREANVRIGVDDDNKALDLIRTKIDKDVKKALQLKAQKGLKDERVGEVLSASFLVRLGKSWRKLPPNQQTTLRPDVLKAISQIIGREALETGETIDDAFAKIGTKVKDIIR